MTRKGARTEADAALAAWVSCQVGWEVKGYSIERWRQRGLIHKSARHYPGRGSTAEYTDEQRQHVAVVACLAKKYRDLDDVARVLFMRRSFVEPAAVRGSLRRFLLRIGEWVGPVESEADLGRLHEKAEKLANYSRRIPMGKHINKRLKKRGTASVLAVQLYANLLEALIRGFTSDPRGMTQMLEATGLVGLVSETISGLGPIAPGEHTQLADSVKNFTLDKALQVIDESPMEDFIRARDLFQLFMPFLKDVATLFLAMAPESEALGMGILTTVDFEDELFGSVGVGLGLLILKFTETEGGQQLLEMARDKSDRFRLMADLTRGLSPAAAEAVRTQDPQLIAALPDEEREFIRVRWAAIEAAEAAVGADATQPPA